MKRNETFCPLILYGGSEIFKLVCILIVFYYVFYRQGLDMVRSLGTAVGISLPSGEFSVDLFTLILQRKTLRGSIVGTRLDLNECLDIASQVWSC